MRNTIVALSAVIGSVFASGTSKDTNDFEVQLGGELQAEAGFDSQKTAYKNMPGQLVNEPGEVA
jgi:hypothetical protein